MSQAPTKLKQFIQRELTFFFPKRNMGLFHTVWECRQSYMIAGSTNLHSINMTDTTLAISFLHLHQKGNVPSAGGFPGPGFPGTTLGSRHSGRDSHLKMVQVYIASFSLCPFHSWWFNPTRSHPLTSTRLHGEHSPGSGTAMKILMKASLR